MLTINTLLEASDLFRSASGIERESTLSYRMFNDNKVLGNLRAGGEITVGRFNAAMTYLAQNWPDGQAMPVCLGAFDPAANPAPEKPGAAP